MKLTKIFQTKGMTPRMAALFMAKAVDGMSSRWFPAMRDLQAERMVGKAIDQPGLQTKGNAR